MVRPFYIEADVEGRQTMLSGGPRRKDGSIYTSIHQRDEGCITTPFKIVQSSHEEAGVLLLTTSVYYKGELIKSHTTNY